MGAGGGGDSGGGGVVGGGGDSGGGGVVGGGGRGSGGGGSIKGTGGDIVGSYTGDIMERQIPMHTQKATNMRQQQVIAATAGRFSPSLSAAVKAHPKKQKQLTVRHAKMIHAVARPCVPGINSLHRWSKPSRAAGGGGGAGGANVPGGGAGGRIVLYAGAIIVRQAPMHAQKATNMRQQQAVAATAGRFSPSLSAAVKAHPTKQKQLTVKHAKMIHARAMPCVPGIDSLHRWSKPVPAGHAVIIRLS